MMFTYTSFTPSPKRWHNLIGRWEGGYANHFIVDIRRLGGGQIQHRHVHGLDRSGRGYHNAPTRVR
jgi:hypothetical protein